MGAHPHVRQCIVLAREGLSEAKQLVAYVVAAQGETVAASELRELAKSQLPDYMVPAAFVTLEKLPLTAHGKVDRRALPEPERSRAELAADYAAPQTEAEQVLAKVWCDVLRLEQVGVHDNFFELGGDSILTIQVISRARELGWVLTPRQFFQYQTIAELAEVAEPSSGPVVDQGPVVGDVELTPVQHWFFEPDPVDVHHFNQAQLLEVPHSLDADKLQQVAELLVSHHDALRLRFRRPGWEWQQSIAETEVASRLVEVCDLKEVSPDEREPAVQAALARTQTSLDLTGGPIVRLLLFESGEQTQRLLIAIHHVAVDGVSWRILVEDFQRAMRQIESGERVQLPSKTTSFRHWAAKLKQYAATEELAGEAEHWRTVRCTNEDALPVDHSAGSNLESSAEKVTCSLSPEETRSLLAEVQEVYHTQINDLLLTALVESLASWTGRRLAGCRLGGSRARGPVRRRGFDANGRLVYQHLSRSAGSFGCGVARRSHQVDQRAASHDSQPGHRLRGAALLEPRPTIACPTQGSHTGRTELQLSGTVRSGCE